MCDTRVESLTNQAVALSGRCGGARCAATDVAELPRVYLVFRHFGPYEGDEFMSAHATMEGAVAAGERYSAAFEGVDHYIQTEPLEE